MIRQIIVWTLVGLLCLTGIASAMSSANYAINWNVIGGGGGGGSSSLYKIQATFGLLAGFSSSTNYRLQGGFWQMMNTPSDTTPPASIRDLHNTTYAGSYINWSWTDPTDSDFSHVLVYIDSVPKPNVPKGTRYYNATGLTANADHTISTRTVDTSGNVNMTWVNQTRRTAPSLATSLVMASPNGGETFYLGATLPISWTYTGSPGTMVNIEVLKGAGTMATIPGVPIGSGGSGRYNVTIPSSTPLGGDYWVRVTSTSNPTYTDTSDGSFTISGPTITITVPNGDETFYLGNTLPMSWTYNGNPGTTVNIVVLKGSAPLKTLSGIPLGSGGSGSFSVTIPSSSPMGNDYQIRVTSTSYPTCTDTSDGFFTIAADSTSSITVIRPNGGENWLQGSDQTFRWTYTGAPGSTVNIAILKGTSTLATIPGVAIGSGGAGEFGLKIPYTIPVGNDYQIKVTSTSNPAYTDTSNSSFSISPAITVVSPNGGETYPTGTPLIMNWTYSGTPGTAVNIDVMKGGATLKTLPGIPLGSGGSGSFSVTIPSTTPLGSDYQIRVTSSSYPACTDMSNGLFTISSG